MFQAAVRQPSLDSFCGSGSSRTFLTGSGGGWFELSWTTMIYFMTAVIDEFIITYLWVEVRFTSALMPTVESVILGKPLMKTTKALLVVVDLV